MDKRAVAIAAAGVALVALMLVPGAPGDAQFRVVHFGTIERPQGNLETFCVAEAPIAHSVGQLRITVDGKPASALWSSPVVAREGDYFQVPSPVGDGPHRLAVALEERVLWDGSFRSSDGANDPAACGREVNPTVTVS